MKSNLYFLLAFSLFLGACEKDSSGEEEPLATDCLVQQVVSYASGEPSRWTKRVYSYDSQNRITQIIHTDALSSNADYKAFASYHYDGKGRIAEIRLSYSTTTSYQSVFSFEYNDQDQLLVERAFSDIVNGPRIEESRVEYFHKATDMPDSAVVYARKLGHGAELFHMLSYKYSFTNGLMTRVKTYPIDPEFQFLPYEDEIRYDTRKAPFSTSPRQVAFMLHYEIDGYMSHLPQFNNVTSITHRRDGGRSNYSYAIQYTFSDEGYPLTAHKKASDPRYAESVYEYSYTCSR